MDDDDISMPSRLERQVQFLDNNPDIFLVASQQRHFGEREWVHAPPETPELLKAALLFKCDVCHTTVMFRKRDFIDHDLEYRHEFLSEDFELWSRAVHSLKFYTLQEVLGEYRWNGDNRSTGKSILFDEEARDIISRVLKQFLYIDITDEDRILLAGWTNPFVGFGQEKKQLRERHERLMTQILLKNKEYKVYDQQALELIIEGRIQWAGGRESVVSKDASQRVSFKRRCKHIIKRMIKPFYVMLADRFVRLLNIHGVERINNEIYKVQNACDSMTRNVQSVRDEIMSMKGDLDSLNGHLDLAMGETLSFIRNEFNNQIIARHELLSHFNNELNTVRGHVHSAKDEMLAHYNDDLKKIALNQLIRISGIEKNLKKVFLFGVPFNQNLGDHAQTYCITEWCKENYPEHSVYEVKSAYTTEFDFYPLLLLIREKLNENDLIFIQSGYHTTDLWYNECILTLAALKVFHDRQIVVFPQTIYFRDEDKKQHVSEVFTSHGNVIFMARDHVSYDYARQMFSKAQLLAVPDVVTMLIGRWRQSYTQENKERDGVLFCLRPNDDEDVAVDNANISELINRLISKNLQVGITDTFLADIPVLEMEANRKHYINETVMEYSKYRLVVTDRYHGAIFSLVANTPVIILETKTHKSSAGYEWFRGVAPFEGYVNYCEDISKLEDTIEHVTDTKLDYSLPPYYYEQYFEGLIERII